MRRSTNEKVLVTYLNPQSIASEAYRTLRTNIRFSSIENPLRVIMVTSSCRGDGKTTTISNLAVAYAQEGKEVLLIDADLRSPSLHQVFSQPNRAGLTTILTEQHPWIDIVKDTAVQNLSLLTSGPIPPNPAEMLSSSRMQSLLETFKERFDVILFDAPPVLGITDSLVLGAMCDGVVLVVSSGKVEKQYVKKAKASLDHVNARTIGVVLNKLNHKDGKYVINYYG